MSHEPVVRLDWFTNYPNFTPGEIYSPETINQPQLLDANAMDKLQEFRYQLREPIQVNHGDNKRRGVRSCNEQRQLRELYGDGAALYSQHVCGRAFDLTVSGMSVEELAKKCLDFGWGFVKPYRNLGFVHVDIRTNYKFQ